MHKRLNCFFKQLIGLSLTSLLVACSDCEPLNNPGNQLIISFFNKENFDADSSLLNQPVEFILSDSDLGDLPIDTLSSSTYGIPLPFEGETYSILINYPDTILKTYTLAGQEVTDTIFDKPEDILTISFAKYFEPISPDCGLITSFENISIDNTTFNHADVAFDFIENNDSTNIRIFF